MRTIITKTHMDTPKGNEAYEAWALRNEALGYRQVAYTRVSQGPERPTRWRGTMRLEAPPDMA